MKHHSDRLACGPSETGVTVSLNQSYLMVPNSATTAVRSIAMHYQQLRPYIATSRGVYDGVQKVWNDDASLLELCSCCTCWRYRVKNARIHSGT
jgi:hypothetical protein